MTETELALASLCAHVVCSIIAVTGTMAWLKFSRWRKMRQRERCNCVIETQMLGMRRVRLRSDDGIRWYKELDWPQGGAL